MKELKSNDDRPIIETHYPIPLKRKPMKRWVIATSSSAYRSKLMHNNNIESDYHRIIKVVKTYLKPGEVYYERDMKTDPESGFLAMHSFITNSFYWRLNCNLCYDYEITFAMSNCPFEEEIKSQIKAYPLDRSCILKELKPDFKAFYETVLNVQSSQHIFSHL